jgi:YegS/Rv2252/BmrU family lipid kinase
VKPFFVVNPHSANGATRQRFLEAEPLIRAVYPAMRCAFTAAPLHATELAERAARDGADVVIAVGGDGTLNEVAGGLLASGRAAETALAMLASGTGGDFRRVAGFPREPEKMAAFLGEAVRRPIDWGMLDYVDQNGKECQRPFVNIASLGISGVVDKFVNATSKALGGRVSFLAGTVRGMLAFKNVPMRVTVDGNMFHEGPTNLVAIANGQYFGGGMRVAPDAKLDDGLFDVVVFEDLSKIEFLALASVIYGGRHLGRPKVRVTRGAVVVVEAVGDALIDLDGEQVGRAPARATMHAGGLVALMPRE